MVNKNKKKIFFFDFTIITIVKNDEKNIENTIKSVLSQKYVKVQYIVLDGYSSDKTFEKLKKFKNLIKIIRFKDKSFYHGLNHALKFATGRFVGILNSGDIYYDRYVLNKVNKKKFNSDFLFGNILYFDKYFNIVREWKSDFQYDKKNFYYYIPHTSLFISLNVMQNHLKHYNLKYKISSDTELIIRLNLIKNLKFKKINEYIVFMKTGGLSTNIKYTLIKILEDLIILKTFFKQYFLIHYLKKVIIKIKGFCFIHKKLYYKKKLKFIHKNLNKNF